jgi:hypothetical protein
MFFSFTPYEAVIHGKPRNAVFSFYDFHYPFNLHEIFFQEFTWSLTLRWGKIFQHAYKIMIIENSKIHLKLELYDAWFFFKLKYKQVRPQIQRQRAVVLH